MLIRTGGGPSYYGVIVRLLTGSTHEARSSESDGDAATRLFLPVSSHQSRLWGIALTHAEPLAVPGGTSNV